MVSNDNDPSLAGATASMPAVDVAGRKRTMRRQLLDTRTRLEPADLTGTADALRDQLLTMPEITAASVLAVYVSISTEPGTRPLLDYWHTAGVRVLLPVMLDDGDLDWAEHEGPEQLCVARHGLLEPTGPRLGVWAVGSAEVVVVPALAVDLAGWRLGRGGGSYDRALARAGADCLTTALVYDHEVLASVPVGPRDRPVRLAVTPQRVLRLS